jgi:hypothetical protein
MGQREPDGRWTRDDGGQRSEVRGRKSEVRGRKSEVRCTGCKGFLIKLKTNINLVFINNFSGIWKSLRIPDFLPGLSVSNLKRQHSQSRASINNRSMRSDLNSALLVGKRGLMVKRLFAVFFAMVLTFGVVQFAHATAYTFDLGTGSSVDTSGTNSVLQTYAIVNPNLGNITFPLDVGQTSAPIYFATIGTTESWINSDDVNPGTVTANIVFDIPSLSQNIEGTSVGFTGFFSFIQGWNLIWNDPVYVETADGLKFSIDLTDVGYASWFWQGPDGTACVYARIKLICNPGDSPSSVPDAGILWLLGPAFIALAILGRKRAKQSS